MKPLSCPNSIFISCHAFSILASAHVYLISFSCTHPIPFTPLILIELMCAMHHPTVSIFGHVTFPLNLTNPWSPQIHSTPSCHLPVKTLPSPHATSSLVILRLSSLLLELRSSYCFPLCLTLSIGILCCVHYLVTDFLYFSLLVIKCLTCI